MVSVASLIFHLGLGVRGQRGKPDFSGSHSSFGQQHTEATPPGGALLKMLDRDVWLLSILCMPHPLRAVALLIIVHAAFGLAHGVALSSSKL
jgi:hypothetical protein